jgi:pimeloyl-ACP methyl ester carboxylesterase
MKAALLVLLIACGGGGNGAGDDGGGSADASVDATPPSPAGCIDAVTAGDHTYTCGGLQVDARIPAACEAPGCGLILELHGDTGTGLLMDGHTNLRALGDQHGYIVVAPTGPPFGGQPGSTWHSSNDATLVDIVQQFASVFRTDPAKTHVTGFSRGGFVTWRLLCDHADVFASAAPGGAGDGTNFGEATCFSDGRMPSRHIPIVFLMGRTDMSVGYASMTQIRDAAVAAYGITGPAIVDQDTTYTHDRWTGGDALLETFDHAYATVSDGPFGYAQGHCIPGSTTDPYAPQYAIPCKLPNSFVWGEQVIAFFIAHPMP